MKSKRGIAAAAIVVSALPFALCAQTLQPAGTVSSAGSTLASGRVTANQYRAVMSMFGYAPGMAVNPYNVIPARMYTATCVVPATSQRKMFVSLGTKSSVTAGELDRQGTIVTATVGSNGAVSDFKQTNFSDCKDMYGIVASNDCSTVAALCRTSPTTSGATDLVSPLPSAPKTRLTMQGGDHVRMYVWNSPVMSSALPVTPSNRYIVAKNVSSSFHYGHKDIVMSGTDYGLSLKGSVIDGTGGQHEINSLVVINRVTPAIDTTRGWITGDCAYGHAHTNRPVVSATDGKFVVLCTTDGDGKDLTPGLGGIYAKIEGPDKTWVQLKKLQAPGGGNDINGGANSFIALPGGGFMGVYAAPSDVSDGRSNIYLVRLNSAGEIVGTYLARSNADNSLGYPQIGYLGKDAAGNVRLLVGWGRMFKWPDYKYTTAGDKRRMAGAYTVQEFDAAGNPVSAIRDVTHGWGELDKMVPLGNGRVGWAYTPDPNYGGLGCPANCPVVMSPTLQWTTYTSTSM